jgi:hypothetical protein
LTKQMTPIQRALMENPNVAAMVAKHEAAEAAKVAAHAPRETERAHELTPEEIVEVELEASNPVTTSKLPPATQAQINEWRCKEAARKDAEREERYEENRKIWREEKAKEREEHKASDKGFEEQLSKDRKKWTKALTTACAKKGDSFLEQLKNRIPEIVAWRAALEIARREHGGNASFEETAKAYGNGASRHHARKRMKIIKDLETAGIW